MKRWSKLQKEIYLLIEPSINLQIHCSVYRMQSQLGSTDLPRYWITLQKDIIFDYPKDFLTDNALGNDDYSVEDLYPHINQISDISHLFREYIDTPKNDIFDKVFDNDYWGLTDILKASDKRVGKNRLRKFMDSTQNDSAKKVAVARLGL